MTAATQTAVDTQNVVDTESLVATPKETSDIWWRRLGLVLIVGSAALTYGGLYLAFFH